MSEISVRQFMRANRFDPTAGISEIMFKASTTGVRALSRMNFRDLNRLRSGQHLIADDRLVSNNSLYQLIMRLDGNLGLYRSRDNCMVWSSATQGTPATHAVLRSDGKLTVCSSDGTSFWAANTQGQGVWLLLQGDGNLIICDQVNNPLWAANGVPDIWTPTIQYEATDGYRYDEISQSWRHMCIDLPCFDALQWPGYASTHIETQIGKQPVIIQLWKGWCQNFMGMNNFPGGVGAEVGVYKRIRGKNRPKALPFLSQEAEETVLSLIAEVGDDDLWWPCFDLDLCLEYTLTNVITGKDLFHAGPENSYWLAKWMNIGSYLEYHIFPPAPGTPYEYQLKYKINGTDYKPW